MNYKRILAFAVALFLVRLVLGGIHGVIEDFDAPGQLLYLLVMVGVADAWVVIAVFARLGRLQRTRTAMHATAVVLLCAACGAGLHWALAPTFALPSSWSSMMQEALDWAVFLVAAWVGSMIGMHTQAAGE